MSLFSALTSPRHLQYLTNTKKIDKREMTLLNREGDLANWQLKCSDQEKTVNQFRDLVTKLQVFFINHLLIIVLLYYFIVCLFPLFLFFLLT